MFGSYTKQLDEKNRIVIPAKFRKELGNPIYFTINPDNVIEIRDEKQFNEFSKKIISNNMLNANAREFARVILGNTEKVDVDKQGRALISKHLLESTNIKKEVVFIGIGNKAEIWSSEKYKIHKSKFKSKNSIEELAKKLLAEGAEL